MIQTCQEVEVNRIMSLPSGYAHAISVVMTDTITIVNIYWLLTWAALSLGVSHMLKNSSKAL